MKLKVTTEITDYKNEVIKRGDTPVLVRDVIIDALNYENANPQAGKTRVLNAKQKVRAFEISLSVMNNDVVELESEDIVMIKEGLALTHSALVFGQVSSLLEQK